MASKGERRLPQMARGRRRQQKPSGPAGADGEWAAGVEVACGGDRGGGVR